MFDSELRPVGRDHVENGSRQSGCGEMCLRYPLQIMLFMRFSPSRTRPDFAPHSSHRWMVHRAGQV